MIQYKGNSVDILGILTNLLGSLYDSSKKSEKEQRGTPMVHLFKQIWRDRAMSCGDLTFPESGAYGIVIEDGHVIAWHPLEDDILLSSDSVRSVDISISDVFASDMLFGKESCKVNYYRLEMTSGEIGILRLNTHRADKVLSILR